MYQDYIKKWFKKIGVALFCTLLMGIVSFFVFGEGSGLRAAKVGQPLNSQNLAQNDQNEPFQEGKHYQKLSAKVTTHRAVQQLVRETPDKIQVIEFFNYACFWCQRLHPKVNTWALNKPQQTVFYRFPVAFNKGWDVGAKAYLMVQMLGKSESLDQEFFKAIHTDNIDLTNEKILQEFFSKHGVDQQKFAELYNSFTVNRAMARSKDLADAYQLTVSPVMIVNGPTGSYLVTSSTAGTEASVMEVVDFLVARESKALGRQ